MTRLFCTAITLNYLEILSTICYEFMVAPAVTLTIVAVIALA